MEHSIQKDGNWYTIVIKGAVTFENMDRLKKVFDDVYAKGSKNVRLDLTEVPSINSSGVGRILMFYKRLRERRGTLEIDGISDNLREMFSLIGVNRLIKINS